MEAHDVRCASCRRRLGNATNSPNTRNAIYCDNWCVEEASVTPEEERNDEWRALVALGMSRVAVARLYGVNHPLVYKVLAKG